MIVLLAILIALDRLTKAWALRALSHGDMLLAPGVNLHLSYNRGISFSMLSSESALGFWLLTGTPSCAIALLGYYAYLQWRAGTSVALGYVFILAGGISNLADCL